MKYFIERFGQWMRHKVRVIIIKQWKRPKTIFRNLQRINQNYNCGYDFESIYKFANTRLGWYRRCALTGINYILSPKVLGTANKRRNRPGLVDPLSYYLK